MVGEKCCDYTADFRGLTPKEFAKEFANTDYFYQRECYKELVPEYKKQSAEDAKRPSLKNKNEKRVQLSSGLEAMANVVHLAFRSMGKVCNACKNHMKDSYEKYSSSEDNLFYEGK